MYAVVVVLLLLLPTFASSQPISNQPWQTGTLSSDTLTINCADLILPFEKGSLLSEPSPTTQRGEMDESLRSAHGVKINLQPQTGTTDDLSTISGCTEDGSILYLSTADAGDAVTVKHNVGNIQFVSGADYVLDDTAEAIIMGLKSGVWIAIGGVGSGGLTSFMGDIGPAVTNVTVPDGTKIDFDSCTPDSADECLIVPVEVSCSSAIDNGQVCFDGSQICIGNGTSPVCFELSNQTLQSVVNNGAGVTTANSEANSVSLGDTTDGMKHFVSAQGPTIKCFESSNTCDLVFSVASGNNIIFDLAGTTGLTIPSTGGATLGTSMKEKVTASVPAGMMDPDGTNCTKNTDVTINSEVYAQTVTCTDNDASTIKFNMPMPNRWDEMNLTLTAYMATVDATPDGNINIDWTSYCAGHNDLFGTGGFATETAPGAMDFAHSAVVQYDLIKASTSGSIPLATCTEGDIISIRGQVDATGTTAATPEDVHILWINVDLLANKWSN